MNDTPGIERAARSPQASTVSSHDSPEPKSNSRTTKAAIRVSLACVQCRSKHVKCDAMMPACLRCKVEDKPCFYAKSRRGIRDPKKRSLISDKPPTLPDNAPSIQLPKVPSIHIPSQYLGDAIPDWNIHSKHFSISPTSEENMFLNAYYTYFHQSHPVLPPKRFFLRHLESDPDSMHFLVFVINFVGSTYLSHTSCDDLRDAAFAAASGPLPMTAKSVQGLFILSIVAMGEAKFEYHMGWANRAVSMAVEIGMHRKTFADAASDPVVAESYRRTYWGLYFLEVGRWFSDGASAAPLYEIATDVELPCEEWEYESGNIPRPVSLVEYELRNNLGNQKFSSFAYLVDLYKISATLVLPYVEAEEKRKADFDRADSLICDWLIKVPKWKMELTDGDGVADLVLFHGVYLAQHNRLLLRQSFLRQAFHLRQTFPLGPASGPHQHAQKVKGFGWNAIPVDVQAANAVCDLFRLPAPIKNLSPMLIYQLVRVALAYLDACVFLGLDTPQNREKLNLVGHIIEIHGETWLLSRKLADEIREVTKEFLPTTKNLPPQALDISAAAATESWVAAVSTSIAVSDGTLMGSDFTFPLFPDLDDWTTHHSDNQINV